MAAALLGAHAANTARADNPLWGPPHGMFFVDVLDDKIVSQFGAVDFGPPQSPDDPQVFFFNDVGNTILAHNLGGQIINLPPDPPTPVLGGIAERALVDPTQPITNQPVSKSQLPPAVTASTVLLADDPGFLSDATPFPGNEIFPGGYRLTASFHGQLMWFDPDAMAWTHPANEQLSVVDHTGKDETVIDEHGQNPVNDPIVIDGTQTGLRGAWNVGVSPPGGSIHSHPVYELRRQDGSAPARGAYLIKLILSAEQIDFEDGVGPILEDSDPLFILFNNRLDQDPLIGDIGEFAAAINQAKSATVPEPATAMIVVAAGTGLLGLRRRTSNKSYHRAHALIQTNTHGNKA